MSAGGIAFPRLPAESIAPLPALADGSAAYLAKVFCFFFSKKKNSFFSLGGVPHSAVA